jgi:hypothetical protein
MEGCLLASGGLASCASQESSGDDAMTDGSVCWLLVGMFTWPQACMYACPPSMASFGMLVMVGIDLYD